MAILDDPLDGLALFQFEGFGQRGGADEVELAGLVGAFNDLDFREVAHAEIIQLALKLVNDFFQFFLTFSELRTQEEGERGARKDGKISRKDAKKCL